MSDAIRSTGPFDPGDLSVDVDDLAGVTAKLVLIAAEVGNGVAQSLGTPEVRQITRAGEIMAGRLCGRTITTRSSRGRANTTCP